MAIDDYDSEDATTGERRSNMKPSLHKASILKNSSKKPSQFSDDDDDQNEMLSSGRLSNRNNRYDSPRSDITSGKPPSGRLHPLALSGSGGGGGGGGTRYDSKNTSASDYNGSASYGVSSSKKANGYSDYDSNFKYDAPSSSSSLLKNKGNLPAITYTTPSKSNFNDSDDSITDRYNKFAKKSPYEDTSLANDSSSKHDKFSASAGKNSDKFESRYDSKFETRYDTFDEDDPKRDAASKFYRSDGPLKSTPSYKGGEALDDLYSKGSSGGRNPRSSSLDRLNSSSAYNNAMSSTFGGSSNAKQLQKFSSTSNINGIDDPSDRSYTANSLNSTSMSIREAKNNFLVGSLSAINGKGLLSTDELERNLPERKARVLVATYNMGGIKKLPENLEELVLPDAIQLMPDVYVIGVQEFDLQPKEWEISLQEQIGPTHVKLSSYYYGSIGINLFIKRELIWFCSVVEFEHINLRAVNGPSKTKASVVISFQLFGTLMCFICSHFAAGEGHIEQRIENYKTTISGLKLPRRLQQSKKRAASGVDGTENFDTVFWFGDFNFLITKERDKVEKKVSQLRVRKSNNYEDIINHDELNQVITQDKAFRNFLEGRITFEPTYKFNLNTDEYDTSNKCRIPSYCDRILYRSRHKGNISCSYYDSIKEMKLSDHRPVFGLFEVNIRPGVDKVALSYGDFDRQVYAAGYQRRQMYRACNVGFNEPVSKKSPCVIQ